MKTDKTHNLYQNFHEIYLYKNYISIITKYPNFRNFKLIYILSVVKLISEIGWNHMGNMTLAKEMIAEFKIWVDFAKFQTWKVKNLKNGPGDKDGRIDIYKKAELSDNQHYELKEFCDEKEIKFLTSVFNIDDLDFLSKFDLEYIKIPSYEVNNIDLIKVNWFISKSFNFNWSFSLARNYEFD